MTAMPERCPAVHSLPAGSGNVTNNAGDPVMVQCRLERDHAGPHEIVLEGGELFTWTD